MRQLSEPRPRDRGPAERSGCPVGGTPVRFPLGELRNDLIGTQRRLVSEQGGFARYQVLRRVFTLAGSTEASQRVLVRAMGNYGRARQHDNLSLLLGRGLICSDGAEWQRQRKLAQPVFGKALMARVVDITSALTQDLLASWDDASRRGTQIDLLNDMQGVTLRVIAMALFGRDIELGDTTDGGPANCFAEAVASGEVVIFRRTISPIPVPLWFPDQHNRRFRRALAAVDRFIGERIDERLAGTGDYDDILSDLIRSYGDRAGAMRGELRDQVLTLFFAGFETTAVSLGWTWLLLSRDAEVEERFHEELDRVLGGRVPTSEDLKSLSYTSQVIAESMRMFPPVFTLPRKAAADDEIGGHAIRRGDNVIVPVHVLHNLPQYWAEPAEFRPERFAPGELTEDQRAAYLPFSAGPRRCLGATFATAEMLTVLAVAGQRVRLTGDPGQPLTVRAAVTQRPAGEVRMRVEPRSVRATS